jgi:hypothetical protein
VDHIDHNALNNKPENLRLVSRSENSKNLSQNSKNKSGYTGIFWDKRRTKWMVNINYKGKTFYIGRFKTLHEAIASRQMAERFFCYHENHGNIRKFHHYDMQHEMEKVLKLADEVL